MAATLKTLPDFFPVKHIRMGYGRHPCKRELFVNASLTTINIDEHKLKLRGTGEFPPPAPLIMGFISMIFFSII